MASRGPRIDPDAQSAALIAASEERLSRDELLHQLRITRRELAHAQATRLEALLPRERWPSIRALAILDDAVDAAVQDLTETWEATPSNRNPTARRIRTVIDRLQIVRTRAALETDSQP